MIFKLIQGIIYNEKDKLWHPIAYREAPLPGPDTSDKPVRHKSIGHHTEGFATRDEAAADVLATTERCKASADVVGDIRYVKKDIIWNGEDVPAASLIFGDDELSGPV